MVNFTTLFGIAEAKKKSRIKGKRPTTEVVTMCRSKGIRITVGKGPTRKYRTNTELKKKLASKKRASKKAGKKPVKKTKRKYRRKTPYEKEVMRLNRGADVLAKNMYGRRRRFGRRNRFGQVPLASMMGPYPSSVNAGPPWM